MGFDKLTVALLQDASASFAQGSRDYLAYQKELLREAQTEGERRHIKRLVAQRASTPLDHASSRRILAKRLREVRGRLYSAQKALATVVRRSKRAFYDQLHVQLESHSQLLHSGLHHPQPLTLVTQEPRLVMGQADS